MSYGTLDMEVQYSSGIGGQKNEAYRKVLNSGIRLLWKCAVWCHCRVVRCGVVLIDVCRMFAQEQINQKKIINSGPWPPVFGCAKKEFAKIN